MSDIVVNVTTPEGADLDRLGREIVRAIRRTEPPATGARNRWEKEWERLTRVPWREWQRRQQARPVKVLIAERPWVSRIWIGGHEILRVIASLHLDQSASGAGELVLRIPLPFVELL